MQTEFRPYSGPEHQPFEFGDGPNGALLIHGFPGTPAEMRAVPEYGVPAWNGLPVLGPGGACPTVPRKGDRQDVAALQALLLSVLPEAGAGDLDEIELDEETRRKLRSLGYVH